MTTQRGNGRGRRPKPDFVVPAESREDGAGVKAGGEGGADGPEAVGAVEAGQKRFTHGEKAVPLNFKIDPAVHLALRLAVMETGWDQQYVINLAISAWCKERGLDPDEIRAGKGYTVSFAGAGKGKVGVDGMP